MSQLYKPTQFHKRWDWGTQPVDRFLVYSNFDPGLQIARPDQEEGDFPLLRWEDSSRVPRSAQIRQSVFRAMSFPQADTDHVCLW
jgi:hypothetical protein